MADCNCGDSPVGRYLGKIGGQAGDRLYGTALAGIGAMQKRFKSWTGLGDYTLNTNSLINSGSTGYLETRTNDGLRIRFREYLGEISTHPSTVGQFNMREFTLNPTDRFCFPWLSRIATQYQQYKPLGVIFEFKSTVSDNGGTNAAIGSILMASEYNVNDPSYNSKFDMLNSAYSQESRLSGNAAHGIECEPTESGRLVYFTNNREVNTDKNDYDLARFTIATKSGTLPANTIVGSLYVHYEFLLMKEQSAKPGSTDLVQKLLYQPTAGTNAMTSFSSWTERLSSSTNFGFTREPLYHGGFRIPRRYAGYRFLFVYSIIDIASAASSMGNMATQSCSYVHGLNPSDAPGYGGTLGYCNSALNNGVSVGTWSWTVCIQVDQVVADYALFGWPSATAWSVNWTGNADALVVIHNVPSDFIPA